MVQDEKYEALVLLSSSGTEEMEFVTAYDVLTRAGILPTSMLVLAEDGSEGLTGPSDRIATCTRNVRIQADAVLVVEPSNGFRLTAHHLSQMVDRFQILVLPGGAPGAARFAGHPAVRQLIGAFVSREHDRWVAAVCASTEALAVGVDEEMRKGGVGGQPGGFDREITVVGHPSVKHKVDGRPGWRWNDEEDAEVQVDGRVITSRGPGTSLLWALEIVQQVLGDRMREEVARPMIVA